MSRLPGALRAAAQRLEALETVPATSAGLGPSITFQDAAGSEGSPARPVQSHPIVAAVASPLRRIASPSGSQRSHDNLEAPKANSSRRDGGVPQQRVAWGTRLQQSLGGGGPLRSGKTAADTASADAALVHPAPPDPSEQRRERKRRAAPSKQFERLEAAEARAGSWRRWLAYQWRRRWRHVLVALVSGGALAAILVTVSLPQLLLFLSQPRNDSIFCTVLPSPNNATAKCVDVQLISRARLCVPAGPGAAPPAGAEVPCYFPRGELPTGANVAFSGAPRSAVLVAVTWLVLLVPAAAFLHACHELARSPEEAKSTEEVAAAVVEVAAEVRDFDRQLNEERFRRRELEASLGPATAKMRLLLEQQRDEAAEKVAEVRLELEAAMQTRIAPLLQLQAAVQASEAAAAAGALQRVHLDSARGGPGERAGFARANESPGGVRVEAEAAAARREAAAAEDRAAAREALEKRLRAKSERTALERAAEAAARSRSRQQAAYLVP